MYFDLHVIQNILSTFFQNAIWVVGFFFLLNKTYGSKKLLQISKIITIVVVAFLFLYSFVTNI